MKTKIIAFLLVLTLLSPTVLSSVALESGDGGDGTPSMQTANPFDYTSLYVDDALIIAFSAAGKTSGDAPTSLTDSLGNTFSVGANAVWGDGALLNRGTVLDFTAAQGTKLNNSSYTYEFVLGYEEQIAMAAGNTRGECFDIGVLKYKLVYTTETVTASHAYMEIGTNPYAWIYDYGTAVWTKKPFLDVQSKGEIIELTQTGELDGSASKIAFSTYRSGKSLGTVSSNSTYKDGFAYTPNLSFKFGKNLNMEIYAVRVYSDLLTDAERAQNHFADVAAYYTLDVTDYLTLTEAEQAKVHEAFTTVRIDRGNTLDMQTYLNTLVAMKGNAPAAHLSAALSFDGYAVSLWSTRRSAPNFHLTKM